MDIIILLILAIGLSFDTFAVSVSCGLAIKEISFSKALRIASSLAFFQGSMLFAGWLAGSQVKDLIIEFDHWIAFGLLLILGLRMIIEGLKTEEENRNFHPLKFMVLIGISIATSIDALAVGISYAFFYTSIITASFVLALVTGTVAMVGILLGKKTGPLLGRRMEILGGIILISIGVKILLEHTIYS